jgi:hypothetical protein
MLRTINGFEDSKELITDGINVFFNKKIKPNTSYRDAWLNRLNILYVQGDSLPVREKRIEKERKTENVKVRPGLIISETEHKNVKYVSKRNNRRNNKKKKFKKERDCYHLKHYEFDDIDFNEYVEDIEWTDPHYYDYLLELWYSDNDY